MAKNYKGSLSLDWFNKQKSILIQEEEKGNTEGDTPAPKINWVNREEALYYEVVDEKGVGLAPFWVDRSDLRVKEARPLVFQKTFEAVAKRSSGSLLENEYRLVERNEDDPAVENFLIRGDSLLALNSLKKLFENRDDDEKVKCIYIDPPFNTEQAFEHYDDNLEHSAWLTLMRDRLVILHQLLQRSGSLFLHVDDNELGYVIQLTDEIFGRKNRISIITFKQSSTSGPKAQNPGLVTTSNFILYYVKDKETWDSYKVFIPTERDVRYNTYITNIEDDYKEWKFDTLRNAFAQSVNIEAKELKNHFGGGLDDAFEQFVIKNANRIVQPANVGLKDVNALARIELQNSIDTPDEIFCSRRESKDDYYFLNGKQILFYATKVREIDGQQVTGEAASTIWDDLLSNNLHKEGEVSFPKGKKPEALLKRIFELASRPGDLILDCFGGSGTSFSVAQKIQRKWIGIEIGAHAETHILPRLKRVIKGDDASGISASVKWFGGGGFKYYKLGDSIIDSNTKDFNWKLGRSFIEESLLSSYDFVPDDKFQLKQKYLEGDISLQPVVGFHSVGSKTLAGVVSLAEPSSEDSLMSYDEIMNLYNSLKDFDGVYAITIFTNRGIELASESKPDDLEIIKVPQAIFADLEK